MNIDYAHKVLNYLHQHPTRHSQLTWGMRIAEHCGTAACIAGTAVLLDTNSTTLWTKSTGGSEYMTGVQLGDDPDNVVEVQWWAAQLLGLDGQTAHSLFHEMNSATAIKKLETMIAVAEAGERLDALFKAAEAVPV